MQEKTRKEVAKHAENCKIYLQNNARYTPINDYVLYMLTIKPTANKRNMVQNRIFSN